MFKNRTNLLTASHALAWGNITRPKSVDDETMINETGAQRSVKHMTGLQLKYAEPLNYGLANQLHDDMRRC